MPGPFDDLIPSQPAQPATPGIIRGQPKPEKPREAPSGYRFTPDGGLAPIPGGPADKPQDNPNAPQLPRGFMWKDGIVGGEAVLIKGIPAPKGMESASPAYSQSAIDAFDRAISTAERLKTHPGFGAAVGSGFDPQAFGSYNPLNGKVLGGTNAAGFESELEAMKAQVFLPMVQSMKGMGALSNAEGDKLTAAIGSLNPNMPEEQFQASLDRIMDDLKSYRDRGAPQKPDALKAKFPEAARFLYSKGELVGYEDASGDFVAVVDNLPQPPDNGGGKGATILPPETPPEGGGGGLGQALYAGVGDIAQGVGEGLGIIGNPLNAGINAIAGTNLSTDLGRTFREATGAPQGDPLASAINRGGVAAMTSRGLGAGLQAASQGASINSFRGGMGVAGNALASQPVQQVVGGMAAGAGTEGARQAGAPPLVQAGAGLLSGVLGYGGVNAMMSGAGAAPNALAPTSSRLIPNAQQVVNTGKASGVRVLTSDVRPPTTRTGKLGRNVGDSIPIAGTAGPRAAQQTERVEAVQKLMKEFGADDTAIEAVSKDLLATRGATIGKLTQAKKSVIEGIPGAVPAPKAIAEIDKQVAKLSGIDAKAYAPVIERLNDFKNALQSGKNLEQVEGQRRLLGDLFADTSLASIKGDGQKAINAIYDPLKQDMGAFIEAAGGPAAKARWAGANERLSAMAGELDASAFKNLLNNAETTPESAAKIIFGKTPSDMKRLYGSLSEKGRTKAQSAIMFQALEKSTSNDMISPQKFATAMEAMSKATGVFFSPADKARIDGITRMLKATQHAAEAAANPMTGAQNTPLIAGLSIGQLFGTAALPATAGAGLLARVYESAPVRDAFLRLGRTKPGSPQERAMLPKVTAALIAANENNPQYMANAPGLSQAAASDQVGKERPIQP